MIEEFYKFCLLKDKWYSCNYKWDKGFSRNYYIKSIDDLKSFINQFGDKDCYITFNPVHEPINRKKENIHAINMIALDFEYEVKLPVETEIRFNNLNEVLVSLIKHFNIESYMQIESGNGYHVWLPIGKPFKLYDSDATTHNANISTLDLAYKDVIEEFQAYIDKQTKLMPIKVYDRKDFGGVLRIPTTSHTKTGRIVKIAKQSSGENITLRKIFLRNKNRKREIHVVKKSIQSTYDGELDDHPLVQLWYEDNLPDGTNKHQTIGYALQSLIYHMGLQGTGEADLLTTELNMIHGISLNLNYCSTPMDMNGIISTSIKWCKENGFKDYIPKFMELRNEK